MAPNNPPSTCLFLPELPADMTDQNLERTFRGFVGFSSCRTRHDRNGKLVGFVEFEEIDQAVRCRESMQGQSPFPGINWHIHYSNNSQGNKSGPPSGAKRPREEGGPPVPRHDAQRHSFGSDGRPVMGPPPGYPRDDPRGVYSASPHPSPMQPPPPFAAPPMYQSPMGAPSDPMAMQPVHPNYMGLSLPHDASSTLYIEGLPPDSTEREVAHVFRRYEGHGFQSVRLRPIDSKNNPGTNLFLCFAEFDNAHAATVALCGLQGYRFDAKAENSGIRISYAKSKSASRSGPSGPPRSLPPPPAQSAPPFAERAPSFEQPYPGQRDDGPRSQRDDDRRGGGGYDDRRGDDERRGSSYDEDRRGGGGYRRDGREHNDRFRDDYDDASERGDDDIYQRADQVSMQGVTD